MGQCWPVERRSSGLGRSRVHTGELIDWYLRASELEVRMEVLPRLVLRRRVHGANYSTPAERGPRLSADRQSGSRSTAGGGLKVVQALELTSSPAPGWRPPTAQQELLLQAALLRGEAAERAWRAWLSQSDIQTADAGVGQV